MVSAFASSSFTDDRKKEDSVKLKALVKDCDLLQNTNTTGSAWSHRPPASTPQHLDQWREEGKSSLRRGQEWAFTTSNRVMDPPVLYPTDLYPTDLYPTVMSHTALSSCTLTWEWDLRIIFLLRNTPVFYFLSTDLNWMWCKLELEESVGLAIKSKSQPNRDG